MLLTKWVASKAPGHQKRSAKGDILDVGQFQEIAQGSLEEPCQELVRSVEEEAALQTELASQTGSKHDGGMTPATWP